MTLVVLAAGMGSRYGGLKQIDPVGPGGEFIIDYSVYDAARAGFDRVVFIIKKEIEAVFKETIGSRIRGIKVDYAFQEIENIPAPFTVPAGRGKPWGTGHALLCAEEAIGGDDFAIINADDFYGRETFLGLYEFMKNRPADGKNHYAMSGFRLHNTVTENGHVSRGVCEVRDGFLSDITERTKIQYNDGVIQYEETDGSWVTLPDNTPVSMNCWAFSSPFFASVKKDFYRFLEETPKEALAAKAEFYLPFCVKYALQRGACDVRVIETAAKWYGVTYHEDKAELVAAISGMIREGIYPEKLWQN